MRISDWSSDVCSSDLGGGDHRQGPARGSRQRATEGERHPGEREHEQSQRQLRRQDRRPAEPGRVAVMHLAPHEMHADATALDPGAHRSEEHTSELQSLMRISYAVFCLKKTKNKISY